MSIKTRKSKRKIEEIGRKCRQKGALIFRHVFCNQFSFSYNESCVRGLDC